MENIIDILNEEETLKNVDDLAQSLRAGIEALRMDFGFHVKGTFPGDKISDLEWNAGYRLFSSRFHFQQLFRHMAAIKQKHQYILEKQSNIPLTDMHLEIDKREISSIVDSIIFHLTSLFDYIASLASHIITKRTDTPDWISFRDSAKNRSSIFKNENSFDIAQVITDADNSFVFPLNKYRSKVIHEVSDVCNYHYSINYMTFKISVWFLCSKFQRKSFKTFGDENKRYSLIFFANFLIVESMEWIAKIISVLKVYMENNSRKDEIAANPRKGMVFFNAKGEVLQMSLPLWRAFHQKFRQDNHAGSD